MIERPGPGPEMKKPSAPGKSENEGIRTNPGAHPRAWLASSFSLTEKLASRTGDSGARSPDEHSQTDILTSGLKPRSRLPGLLLGPVAVAARIGATGNS